MKLNKAVALLLFCIGFWSVSLGQINNNEDEISGEGTQNFIPKFTSHTTIGNSQLFQGNGIGFENSKIVLGIGTKPNATLNLNVGGTGHGDTIMLGDCPVRCLAIGDENNLHVQAYNDNLVVSGNTLYLDSATGTIFAFNAEKTPEANFGIDVDVATNILTIKQNSVTKPIADAWTTYSSARWKTNIQPIANALDKVQKLRGVTFDWKANGKHDLGVVAEEVAPVVPEIVGFERDGKAQSVDYGRLTALLVEAIKEQQTEIRELKLQIEMMAVVNSTPATSRSGTN
jgi:hypothetical protein